MKLYFVPRKNTPQPDKNQSFILTQLWHFDIVGPVEVEGNQMRMHWIDVFSRWTEYENWVAIRQ